jgi:hypothetical protein
MIPDDDQIRALIARPGESLNVEIKRWLDPSEVTGAAEIVKATFALRNRNGGFLVIGFDDKTLEPDLANAPPDVRGTFHQDTIQALISRFAYEPFEVQVAFAERDGRSYPVIAIPQGARVPAVVKTALTDAGNNKLLAVGEVYFRTLHANGTPSSAIARPQDWRDILEICFDNREADIGRFLRRQLGSQDLLRALVDVQRESETSSSLPAVGLRERCTAVLAAGDESFARAVKERTLTPQERLMLNGLTWSIALLLDPPKDEVIPDREFFATFAASNPKYTGWPIWLDARTLSDERSRPAVKGSAWEALIVALSDHSANRLEFFRVDPRGVFYLRRLLQDDAVPKQVEPGTRLDPVLVIYRVTEATAVGIAIAKGLGWPETTRLGFLFRWQKLKGRRLDSWANPIIYVPGGGPAQEDEITSFIEVPITTAFSALAPLVEAATRNLFVTFDGTRLSSDAYDEHTRRLVERRLNG